MVNNTFSSFDRLKKAIIKWGYECNNNCIFCHCFEYKNKKYLTREGLLKKIDAAQRLGVEVILFSGGEPLLIGGVEQIMAYALKKGMYSGLITNGRPLSSATTLKKLYRSGLRYVYMSLTGLDPRTYKNSTRRDAVKESILAIINLLKYKDISLTINIPIIRQNISLVDEMIIKLIIAGVKNIKLSVIEPKGLAWQNYDSVVPSLSETSTAISTAIREAKKLSGDHRIFHDGLPFCLSPDYSLYNRDLFSENILYMSEAFEKKFYKTEYDNRGFVKGVCDTCSKKSLCSGIYNGYIKRGDIPLVPIGRKKRKSIINDKCKNDDINFTDERNYEVNIGKLCNNACIFCANGIVSKEENKFVEYEKIVSEIKKAKNEGFSSLGILGGDITVHPNVLKIVEFARKTGFKRIAICTNGRRLSDLSFAKSLIGAGATRFMISIHSHREEVENYLNGRKNSFSEKIAAIKNLVQLNSEKRIEHGISLNCCVHKLNYRELIDFVLFFKNLGINDIRFNFIRPENKAEHDKNIIPSITEVHDYIDKLIEFNEKEGSIHMAFGDIPFCLLPEKLLKNRDLLRKYIGELKDLDTFVTTFRSRTDPNFIDRFNWRERKTSVLKSKSPICNKCIFDSVCEGLFKSYINLYGIKELKPIYKL